MSGGRNTEWGWVPDLPYSRLRPCGAHCYTGEALRPRLELPAGAKITRIAPGVASDESPRRLDQWADAYCSARASDSSARNASGPGACHDDLSTKAKRARARGTSRRHARRQATTE